MINEAQCVLRSLENTTLTGLFFTAKLFAAVLNAGPLSPQCSSVMYVVIIVQHTQECALTLACVMHTKEGP